MMNAQITRLRAIHRLESKAALDEYDELIGQLARAEPLDPDLLDDLLKSFFDTTEGREVMWGLLHHVEDYPAALYITRLAETLPQMLPQAHDWALLLLRRLLNTAADRSLLGAALRALPPPARQTALLLLRELVQEDAAVAPQVAEVSSP